MLIITDPIRNLVVDHLPSLIRLYSQEFIQSNKMNEYRVPQDVILQRYERYAAEDSVLFCITLPISHVFLTDGQRCTTFQLIANFKWRTLSFKPEYVRTSDFQKVASRSLCFRNFERGNASSKSLVLYFGLIILFSGSQIIRVTRMNRERRVSSIYLDYHLLISVEQVHCTK